LGFGLSTIAKRQLDCRTPNESALQVEIIIKKKFQDRSKNKRALERPVIGDVGMMYEGTGGAMDGQ
jgi:hypothetical protein